jgi:DNA-directed RNA polymerase specialized sigma subunit
MQSKAKQLRTTEEPPHRILREVFRHYLEYRDLVGSTGESIIQHGYFVYDDDGNIVDKKILTLSFWDLVGALKPQSQGGILSDRKREAVFYNVILDKKQRDVAAIMGITTVSVGQYVEQAMTQLAANYFTEELGSEE